MRPDLIMRSILPVIMAGILGIYGLIISIVISSVSELLSPTPAPAQLSDAYCFCRLLDILLVDWAIPFHLLTLVNLFDVQWEPQTSTPRTQVRVH